MPKGSLNKKEPAPVQFKGGEQGFVSLKLDSIENINNNTKKFHFAFEDPAMESGLPVACEFWRWVNEERPCYLWVERGIEDLADRFSLGSGGCDEISRARDG